MSNLETSGWLSSVMAILPLKHVLGFGSARFGTHAYDMFSSYCMMWMSSEFAEAKIPRWEGPGFVEHSIEITRQSRCALYHMMTNVTRNSTLLYWHFLMCYFTMFAGPRRLIYINLLRLVLKHLPRTGPIKVPHKLRK